MRLTHFQCLSLDLTWNFFCIFFLLQNPQAAKLLKNFSNKSISLNEFSSSDKKSEAVEKKHSLTLLLIITLFLSMFQLLDWHGKFYFNGMNESDQNAMPEFLANGKTSNISKGYAALGQQHSARSHNSLETLQTVHWALKEQKFELRKLARQ